jgi:hypothetical protein
MPNTMPNGFYGAMRDNPYVDSPTKITAASWELRKVYMAAKTQSQERLAAMGIPTTPDERDRREHEEEWFLHLSAVVEWLDSLRST